MRLRPIRAPAGGEADTGTGRTRCAGGRHCADRAGDDLTAGELSRRRDAMEVARREGLAHAGGSGSRLGPKGVAGPAQPGRRGRRAAYNHPASGVGARRSDSLSRDGVNQQMINPARPSRASAAANGGRRSGASRTGEGGWFGQRPTAHELHVGGSKAPLRE